MTSPGGGHTTSPLLPAPLAIRRESPESARCTHRSSAGLVRTSAAHSSCISTIAGCVNTTRICLASYAEWILRSEAEPQQEVSVPAGAQVRQQVLHGDLLHL